MQSLDDTTARLRDKAQRAGLRFHPPASEEQILKFEEEAGVDLPLDYRSFLLHVGNGGKRPSRVLPLERWSASYWIDKVALERDLRRDCLIKPEAEEQGEDWLTQLGVEDLDGKWDRNEWDPMMGSLAVAEIGCGLFFSLIVNGPHRGRIFSWGDMADNPPIFVEQANFAEWMEFCLDALLEGHAVHFLNGRF